MNEEQKDIFHKMDDSDIGEDDEIEDDFIAMLNDGMPALLKKDGSK